MYMSETVSEKWKDVIDHPDLPEIKDSYRRDVTLRLLENQEKFLAEASPTMSAGVLPDTGGVAKWDPILISLVRRAMPQMIAYDVCGVQPMTGPTGLIFAMKAKYDNFAGNEALFDEPLAGLDKKTRQNIVNLIKDTCKNKTVIIVTHDQEIIPYVDKIVKLHQSNNQS